MWLTILSVTLAAAIFLSLAGMMQGKLLSSVPGD
jgi:hypothetical protein